MELKDYAKDNDLSDDAVIKLIHDGKLNGTFTDGIWYMQDKAIPPKGIVPCPKCGSTDVDIVNWTLFGGFIGARIFNQTKCNKCSTQYNGKTGKSNSFRIILYLIISIICGVLVYYLSYLL